MTASSSYEERHDRAADTFSVFAPDVEPERVASSMARRLGALGSFAFDVVGEMWARPELSRRDRSLIVVSTLAAQARDEELELHTGVALRNGLTRTEIEELVVTVAAYAGFPAAMAASRRVDTALRAAADVEQLEGRQAAAAKSDAERDRDAAEVLAGMTVGVGDPATVLASLADGFGWCRGTRIPVGVRRGLGEVRARPAGPIAGGDRDPHVARRRRRAQVPRSGGAAARPDRRRGRGGDHPPRALRRVPACRRGDASRPGGDHVG